MECCGSDPDAPLARYIQTAKKCRASTTCHTQKSFQRGRARASRGISQITNCGEYTLLVSTKPATTRKVSCASRGGCLASTPSRNTTAHQRANTP